MTPNEINRAIAEECGWKNVHYYEDNAGPGFWSGVPPISEEEVFKMPQERLRDLRKFGTHLPNFHGDLNSMHEAEKGLSEDQGVAFRIMLITVVCTTMKVPTLFAIHATAAQRAEAFLRTKSKWKE